MSENPGKVEWNYMIGHQIGVTALMLSPLLVPCALLLTDTIEPSDIVHAEIATLAVAWPLALIGYILCRRRAAK